MCDDDDPWTTESDDSWYPPAQDAPAIEVDWEPPEPAGHLWYPDGSYSVVEQDKAPFGFGRWLYEQGEQMGLLDEVKAETRHGGGVCAVKTAFDALTPKVRAEWEELFASDAPHTAIARLSQKPQHVLGLTKGSVQRHRNGDCLCHS